MNAKKANDAKRSLRRPFLRELFRDNKLNLAMTVIAAVLEALAALLCERPRRRFGLPLGEDWSLWDLETEYTIDPADFLSKGKASPFTGRRVFGRCLQTAYNGQTVYREK